MLAVKRVILCTFAVHQVGLECGSLHAACRVPSLRPTPALADEIVARVTGQVEAMSGKRPTGAANSSHSHPVALERDRREATEAAERSVLITCSLHPSATLQTIWSRLPRNGAAIGSSLRTMPRTRTSRSVVGVGRPLAVWSAPLVLHSSPADTMHSHRSWTLATSRVPARRRSSSARSSRRGARATPPAAAASPTRLLGSSWRPLRDLEALLRSPATATPLPACPCLEVRLPRQHPPQRLRPRPRGLKWLRRRASRRRPVLKPRSSRRQIRSQLMRPGRSPLKPASPRAALARSALVPAWRLASLALVACLAASAHSVRSLTARQQACPPCWCDSCVGCTQLCSFALVALTSPALPRCIPFSRRQQRSSLLLWHSGGDHHQQQHLLLC